MKQPYIRENLGNGITIISHPMPQRASFALGLWAKVGGRYENKTNKGIAHFLEHMVFKGTKKYTCRQLKESVEGIGGSLNAFTSEELTCYMAKVPSGYVDVAVDVLSDMVVNPLLPPQEMEREKTVIVEEIKMYKDLPQAYVYDLLDELLWPDQPLGTPIIGAEETVRAISRQGLQDFKDSYYVPGNIVVSAVGAFEHGELCQAIKGVFSSSTAHVGGTFLPVCQQQHNPQLRIFPKATEQTHLAMGFHSFKRDHPHKHALALLHIVLGANMSSRLFNEVREERGLAYEIGTHVKRYHDTGAFLVHAGMDNSKVSDCVALILKELQNVKQELITPDEFRRAKEFYIGQLKLALEDTFDYMLWLGENMSALGKVFTIEEIIEEVQKVTPEEIRKVAQEVFNNANLNMSLIGPLQDKEQAILSGLSIG